MNEDHPLQGQSPYSASKIAADKLVESYHSAFGLPVITVRPFNTYGPRQSARAVIPTIITQVLAGKELLIGNLDSTRDFTYVDDTVDGFIASAIAKRGIGETFNLGTGEEIRIGALADKVMQIIGRQIPIRVEPERLRPGKSEVMRLLSDNHKARDVLKWQPRVDLDKGLEKTINWINVHLDRYRIGKYEF
jgi:dTDP-glucose 4,6-dehydratase